jgi:crotonobetainyl-CoA:carnitine CoA-transferase CaiB-like acyl-CoA transferase
MVRHPFKGEARLKGAKPRNRYIEDWEIIEALSLVPKRKLVSGVSTAMGILAALVERHRGGDTAGTHIEASVFEAVSLLTVDAMTQAFDHGSGASDPPSAGAEFLPQDIIGDYLSMHLSSSEQFLMSLVRAVGREDPLESPPLNHGRREY